MSDKVKVKLDEPAFLPERAHKTDAGADLRTPTPFVLRPESRHIVYTGVHVEIPKGHVGLIESKSGLNMKYSIVAVGVIDEGYSGEIIVNMINLGPYEVVFGRGDKIAQLLIMPVEYSEFEEVDEIESGERGSNGFGSTGK